MLTLNDGRNELWQWDTGRKLTVDADCSQVHFSNKVFGRSIDVDVVDGTAEIPDVLLQVDKDLFVWAFVGTAENGYTKISKVFKVNKRNKPADYVFTPTDQTSVKELKDRLEKLEASQDPEAIGNAVKEYLKNNPIKEEDPTVPDWAKEKEKPKYTAKEVGAVATVNGISPDANGNVEIPVSGGNADQSGGLSATASALLITILRNGVYNTNQSANITALEAALASGGGNETPDEPVNPEKTLASISATYSGGDVPVGTSVLALTGIVVTAHYSDGSTETVTGYTLSGEIAEGSNTVTVSYGGKTTTFAVTGVAESGDDEPSELTYSVQNYVLDGTNCIDTGIAPFSTDHDWTIACKFLHKSIGNRAYLWAATTSSWGDKDGLGARINDVPWFGESKGTQWCGTLTSDQKVRCVFTHTVGGGMTFKSQVINANGSNGHSFNGTVGDGTQVVTTNENLIIGANKPNNKYLTGEIYDFQLLDTVWDDDTISAYLASE